VAIEQTALRLLVFAGVFLLLAVGESAWPRRANARQPRRWIANFGLLVLNTAVLRLAGVVLPALAVAAAYGAEQWHWGLLPLFKVPQIAAFIIGFVVLDLAVYGQHVAMHAVPVLWRMHRVHHADTEFDVTTGLRFHPLEILVSQAWKIGVIILIGIPVATAFAFEITLNASSMFSHANLRLPFELDRWMRLAVVTPDMHRVHHSVERDERDTNYGFNLALWDRLFATYREGARAPHETMPIGLGALSRGEPADFFWLLRFPFAREVP
jgi:sterol desaturase/sphingolipid hydroxylase (fatty acid hydroxylase superfamily)